MDACANAQTTNGLTQKIVVSDVYRNSSDAIVTTGGTLDPSTKQVTITISWTQPSASSISSTFYMAEQLIILIRRIPEHNFQQVLLTVPRLVDQQLNLGREMQTGVPRKMPLLT